MFGIISILLAGVSLIYPITELLSNLISACLHKNATLLGLR